MQSRPVVGVLDAQKEKYLFAFPWVDGASTKREHLDFVIRVTPYNLYGQPGVLKDLRIRSAR